MGPMLASWTLLSGVISVSYFVASGTRWLQEILYAVVQGGQTDRVGQQDTDERFPFLESSISQPGQPLPMDILPTLPSPRLIKTHLQREFFDHAFNKTAKFVVLVRNPKDVLVSYYHFYRNMPRFDFHREFDYFFELFKAKKLLQGDWFDWLEGWVKEFENSNCIFVTYEDMQTDINKEIRRLAEFLGKNFSEDTISAIAQSCSFENLKNKANLPQETKVFRKGVTGDWRNQLSAKQSDYIDQEFECRMGNIKLNLNMP